MDEPNFMTSFSEESHVATAITHYMAQRCLTQESPLDLASTNVNRNGDTPMEHHCDRVSGPLNSVTLFSKRADLPSYEEQYNRFRVFVGSLSSAGGGSSRVKSELRSLLYSAFVNIAIEMCCKAAWSSAQSFVSKHKEDYQHAFADVSKLLEVTTLQNIDCNDVMKEIRETKMSVQLSQSAYNRLQQYLRHGNQTLLLQIFNRYVHLDIGGHTMDGISHHTGCSSRNHAEADGGDEGMLSFSGTESNSLVEKEMISFQAAVKGLNATMEPAPSICFYTVVNSGRELASVKFSQTCDLLFSGFNNGVVSVWSLLPNGFQKNTSGAEPRCSEKGKMSLIGHAGAVYGLSSLHDQRFLLSSSEDMSVRLWDLKTGSTVVTFDGHVHPVWDVDASPSDGYFCSCSEDRTARLWNTEYAFPLRIFAGHTEGVDCVKFHPNGNFVGTGSSDHSCRLWDVNSGQFVRVFVGHKSGPNTLAFSSDGKFMASAGEDRLVYLWDIGSGRLVKQMSSHTDSVQALSFSADGSMLASGGSDNSIRIWRTGSSSTDDASADSGIAATVKDNGDIGVYPTKNVPVFGLHFAEGNLLFAAGSSQ